MGYLKQCKVRLEETEKVTEPEECEWVSFHGWVLCSAPK